ncbi:GntG family PLP-dependent aldolase [Pontibacter sp. G13]|uniref:threonine aldolase family protein n=1 Tax=Pontibacter sp. G13 TaxID=3074898 RepID=UPI00288AB3DB|nr:GntG family PLP-dependent aldolase [Pontibacter sp. G13]WNJ19253.1 GntG family PLP-dependent aldolase [Pontibacter sp. G13]
MAIDFRSDTVTVPTAAMKEAMIQAQVGDDMYGEDPAVNALQEQAAEMFGMEAGLFCPSGTMCNQIAIRVHTQPQDEVICDHKAHIYLYEGGGMAANSLVSARLLPGDRGRLTASQVEEAINADDIHFPRTSLVALENTSNKGGGSCYSLETIREIKAVCEAHGLALHLDGARLFNALVATGQSPKDHGRLFDTISICLSKGLGAPMGSILLGSKAHIRQALRVRKVLGGAMRQVGFMAAAASYALDHHIDRLAEDHARAKMLEASLQQMPWVEKVLPVETNLVGFKPNAAHFTPAQVIELLKKQGVWISNFGGGYVRMVTHLNQSDADIKTAIRAFETLAEMPVGQG